jgi:hypothetical protein
MENSIYLFPNSQISNAQTADNFERSAQRETMNSSQPNNRDSINSFLASIGAPLIQRPDPRKLKPTNRAIFNEAFEWSGLNQTEMMELTGIPQPTLSWLQRNDDKEVSDYNLRKLEAAMGAIDAAGAKRRLNLPEAGVISERLDRIISRQRSKMAGRRKPHIAFQDCP